MIMKRTILLLLFLLSASSCTLSEKNLLTIGTFNIAWLGDGENDRKDRTEEEYRQIAEIIKDTKADLLALQEIENGQALEKLLKYLPAYSYKLSETGGAQKVGFLYKDCLEVDEAFEYMPIAIKKNRQRPGYIIKARKGNFDFIAMAVHFKSTSRYDDTKEKKKESRKIRRKQARLASKWVDSVLSSSDERDVFILGDFNDTPTRKKYPTLNSLIKNDSLIFHTTNIKSCKNKSWYLIDHIVFSVSVENRYLANSSRVYNIYNALPKEKAKKVSDHCPVLMNFETESPDND